MTEYKYRITHYCDVSTYDVNDGIGNVVNSWDDSCIVIADENVEMTIIKYINDNMCYDVNNLEFKVHDERVYFSLLVDSDNNEATYEDIDLLERWENNQINLYMLDVYLYVELITDITNDVEPDKLNKLKEVLK